MSINIFPLPGQAVDQTAINSKGDLFVGQADNQAGILTVGSNGQTLQADSTQALGIKWATVSKTIRVAHTFAVSGQVYVPVGDTYFIPPFFAPVPVGQTVTIAAARYKINSGTSVTFNINKNGTTVTGLSALSASTTATTALATGLNVCVADDPIALVVTAVSGTPMNMTVTLYLDYAV